MLSQKLLPRGTTVAYLHRDIWIWETTSFVGLPRWRTGKESNCQCRRHRRHRLDPWNRKWQPISVFLLWLSHGQRSPAGYSPWGCKESGTTRWLGSTPFCALEWLVSGHNPGTEKGSERKRWKQSTVTASLLRKALSQGITIQFSELIHLFLTKETSNIKMHLPKIVAQQYTHPHSRGDGTPQRSPWMDQIFCDRKGPSWPRGWMVSGQTSVFGSRSWIVRPFPFQVTLLVY